MKTLKILPLLLLFTLISAISQDKALFNEAKLLIFDGEWEQALENLNRIEKEFSETSLYPMVIFYKGKCLEEIGSYKLAIASHESFLNLSDNVNLKEEAEVSIINNAYSLYKKGNTTTLKKITDRLNSRSKTIQYYAAFKLSYDKNKDTASKAIPVLNKILSREKDKELLDRAKLALLRINPKELEKAEKKNKSTFRTLKIRVSNTRTGEQKITINIPLALAELAIKSLPEMEKETLKKEGYDIDTLMDLIVETGEIISIEDGDEKIKIWIE